MQEVDAQSSAVGMPSEAGTDKLMSTYNLESAEVVELADTPS
jgi:hypothetical protein